MSVHEPLDAVPPTYLIVRQEALHVLEATAARSGEVELLLVLWVDAEDEPRGGCCARFHGGPQGTSLIGEVNGRHDWGCYDEDAA